MDKLKLAHEFAMQLIKAGATNKTADIIKFGWEYADAMQAEADSRVNKERPDVLQEWQPDWSQAPDWANWWALDLDNLQAHWYENRPNLDVIAWHRTTRACKQASLFDYDGDWYDSLRKRP